MTLKKLIISNMVEIIDKAINKRVNKYSTLIHRVLNKIIYVVILKIIVINPQKYLSSVK